MPFEVAVIVALYWVTTVGMIAWLLKRSADSEGKALGHEGQQ
jgi:hypothetical protein